MTTKHDVIDLHRKHPDWTAPEIAERLGCHSAYVRATAQRCSLDLPKGTAGGALTPEQAARIKRERRVGRAALAAGLTLKKIDQIARGRT